MRLEAVPEKSTPMFILVNALDTVEMPFFEKSSDDHLLNGVLLPVLAVIFMLKGKVKEGEFRSSFDSIYLGNYLAGRLVDRLDDHLAEHLANR